MKKILILISCCLMIAFIILYPSKTHYEASNNPNTYEYYYNNETSDEDIKMNVPESEPSPIHSDSTALPVIDTTSDSITVFVNKEYALPSYYIPADLTIPKVLFDFSGILEKKYLRSMAATALENLFDSAKERGYTLYAISGYRSYARQKEIYTNSVLTRGITATNLVSAVPGFSEHQTGLAMDISCSAINFRLSEVFSGTPEGKWVAQNCYRYGYIIRYPKDQSSLTGYSYEPWHIRYVGKPLAKYLFENKITLEEYYKYKPDFSIINPANNNMVIDVEDYRESVDPTTSPTKKPTASPKASKKPKDKSNNHTTTNATPPATETPVNIIPTAVPIEVPLPSEIQVPQATSEPSPAVTVTPTTAPTATPDITPQPTDASEGSTTPINE